jgi:NAD(P)-dependent dehydrogenase (short-subunit alcohol dehydrogenase family)
MGDLDGRTILLTGASKGIGAAAARLLLERGARLVAQYGGDRAGAEAATAGAPPDRCLLLPAGFADPGAADRLWAEAEAWAGRIHCLVNNAAMMRLAGTVASPDAEWDEAFDAHLQVNLLAPARLTRAAVRHFLARGGGSVITISSWVVHRGASMPEGLAYSASKGAMAAFTKTLARVHAKDDILVHLIAPGVVGTRMSEDAAAALGGVAAVRAGLAMGDWVPPGDIAEVIAFLATGRVRHLSGATIDVNGASYVR